MNELPTGAVPSPFHEVGEVTPEQLADCIEFLDNVWLVINRIREVQPVLDRVYQIQDKVKAMRPD